MALPVLKGSAGTFSDTGMEQVYTSHRTFVFGVVIVLQLRCELHRTEAVAAALEETREERRHRRNFCCYVAVLLCYQCV